MGKAKMNNAKLPVWQKYALHTQFVELWKSLEFIVLNNQKIYIYEYPIKLHTCQVRVHMFKLITGWLFMIVSVQWCCLREMMLLLYLLLNLEGGSFSLVINKKNLKCRFWLTLIKIKSIIIQTAQRTVRKFYFKHLNFKTRDMRITLKHLVMKWINRQLNLG